MRRRHYTLGIALWVTCFAGVLALGPFRAEASVPDNRVLTCTGITPDRYDVCAGVAVKLSAYATDPNGKRLTYRWETTGGKVVADGSKATLFTDGLKPGKYTVTAQVSDGYNPSVECSVDITIIDAAQLAHAAERAQRDRSFALDAVARAR